MNPQKEHKNHLDRCFHKAFFSLKSTFHEVSCNNNFSVLSQNLQKVVEISNRNYFDSKNNGVKSFLL